MPQEAEDLAEDMIFRLEAEQRWLDELQRRVLSAAERIQTLPKSQLNKFGPTAVRARMLQLNREMLNYYRTVFDDIYLAGARSVDPSFTIGRLERSRLAQFNVDEYLKLRSAAENTVRDSKRFIEMVWNDRADRRKKLNIRYNKVDLARKSNQDINTFEHTLKNRGIRSVIYRNGRKHTLGNYGQMSIRSGASRAYNLGALDAASRKNIQWMAVSDGPECGWTFHDDPETANGAIVTIDEARAYPIAHPNCKRQFRPATPQQIKNEEARRARKEQRDLKAKRERTKKLAERAAVGLAVGLAGLEATNLAVAGAERFVKTPAFQNIMQELAQQAFHGDRISRWFVQRLGSLESQFVERPLASVSQIYPGGPPTLPRLPLWDNVRYFADGFAEGSRLNQIPDYIRRALGAADDAIEAQLEDRFQVFYQAAKKAALAQDTGENIARVLSMEARRRGLFVRELDRLGGSSIRATWSKWGPRARVDITDWFRAKTTITKTGAINTLAVNAAGQLRGVFKIYQDGLMGGHISAIPKNFLNGIVRAIVEIDEQGHLVGNLRLIPGGPLRLRLEFITDNVTQDLRDFRINPLGALGNIVQQFQKFKFDRAVLELRIFNQSVFDISANLRIPISAIKDAIQTAVAKGEMHVIATGATGITRYSGLLKYFIKDAEFVKKIYAESKASLFGNIRFSSLTAEARQSSLLLRTLGNMNVRLLTRAHLVNSKLQDIATNMRIHGWNIYDIANVLQLRMADARNLVFHGLVRLRTIMEDWGLVLPEDVLPTWQQRISLAQRAYAGSRDFRDRRLFPNVLDTLNGVIDAFTTMSSGQRVSTATTNAMRALIGAQPGDSAARLYMRIRNTLAFIKAYGEIEHGPTLAAVDLITDAMMRNAARVLAARQSSVLRLV